MLEEPFWLGLITVFSVLLVILFVYCIKRKFADKIEKFLAEEIEKSKYQPSPPAARYSLSSTQHSLTPGNQSPQTNPKSLFSRIRKNSILNLSFSPSATQDREQSNTFSFDDLFRRKQFSSRKNKSPNKTSSPSGPSKSVFEDSPPKDAAKDEKSRILSLLVTGNKEAASRRMSLDEFFKMNERKLQLTARRANSTNNSEGESAETSFITQRSPNPLRKSFTEIHSIQEQSFEYMSSSESFNEEPSTSEVRADVSPTPTNFFADNDIDEGVNDDNNINESLTPVTTDVSSLPGVDEPCESVNNVDCKSEDETCSGLTKTNPITAQTPIISKTSSFLEVPQAIPSINVFCAESSEPQLFYEETVKPHPIESGHFSPCKRNFAQPRKYSVDLPVPKILITTNTGSIDSDDVSPPRTPNQNKSMMYLSPLAVISSSTDRTISESNLSTSGYSSISSPGLSRCNSSSPISDEVEQNHHPNCNRKNELSSPRKSQGVQMTYLTVGGNDKTFFFPQAIACHCHTPSPAMFETKTAQAVSASWTPEKRRPLCKRNSYQTTSTDDSIDDEGIGMDSGDFKICSGEANPSWNVEMFVAGQEGKSPPSLAVEESKPDLLACSVNTKTSSGASIKTSPRTGQRKGEKAKKYAEKHRRSPVLVPNDNEASESRMPRNSSRTSMSGVLVSSSESDDPDGYAGIRQKNQIRRSKRHDIYNNHKQSSIISEERPTSKNKSSHAAVAGRTSPVSESNGDSAPMDSRSPATSSSESLSSTRDSATSEKTYCIQHRLSLEHARSFPPLGHCSLHKNNQESSSSNSATHLEMSRHKPHIKQQHSEDVGGLRLLEDHPCLKRQEAVIEDDPSDDSSSETTVLLGRQSESPRNLPQSSSADVSEWEAFSKD